MQRYDKEYWKWVEQHAKDDVAKLRLANYGNDVILDAIVQIDCRQRASRKLRQTLQQIPHFIFPNTLSAEQCTGDDIATYHSSLLQNGLKVLDMTSGLGIDAMHFAEYASKVTACDLKEENVAALRANSKNNGLQNLDTLHCDSVDYLNQLNPDSYDAIYIDPARRSNIGSRVFALDDCSPDITSIMDQMLKVASTIVIKASPMLDISNTLSLLPNITTIKAIGDKNDCKELIIIVERNCEGEGAGAIAIESVTIEESGSVTSFSYTKGDKHPQPVYSLPKAGNILLIPYPSMMKTAGYNYLSNHYSVHKISSDSHLFTTSEQIDSFPGRQREIIRVVPFNKKGIAEIYRTYKQADVATRGFGMSVDQLSKRLKIKAGGDIMLYGVTDADGCRQLIVTHR